MWYKSREWNSDAHEHTKVHKNGGKDKYELKASSKTMWLIFMREKNKRKKKGN